LIDLADEVAYNMADLDDGYEAGLLHPAQIAAAVPAWAEIFETVETQYPGASEREQFQEALRELFDRLVTGLIDGTIEAARASGAANVVDVALSPADRSVLPQREGNHRADQALSV